MRYNRLGQTGLFVSELCLGTMTFGANPGPFAATGWLLQDEADLVVGRAFDAGINFIDTANVYGGQGGSEEMVGQSLRNLGIARNQVVLSTKVEGTMGSGPNDGGASRYHIMDQIKASLRRIGTDHIDLYQIHAFDPATPAEETIRALDDVVRQGHVRYLGISNWAAWQIARALGTAERLSAHRFQSVQAYYSLVGRDVEREIVPMTNAEGLGLMVWGPLAGGYLTGKYKDAAASGRRRVIDFPRVDPVRGPAVLAALEKIAPAYGASNSAITLAWLLHKPAVSSVIIGVKGVSQLDQNLDAAHIRLSDADIALLDEAGAIEPEYPAWMVHIHGTPRRHLLETGMLPAV